MRRVFIIFLILLIFPCLVWSQEYKIKPGVVIDKDNYEKYLPELEKYLYQGAFIRTVNGLKKGWITVPIVERKDYPDFKAKEDATIKYASRCKIGPDNALTGWVAGLPFPDPKKGVELAWNIFTCSGAPDDVSFESPFLLFDKNEKLERTFYWKLISRQWMGRLTIPPIPEVKGNNGKIKRKVAFVILKPFDVKGFSMLRITYMDINKDDDVYSYVPAIRRIRRLTGSDVTDPLLGSDQVYDDFETWQQKLNIKMTFRMMEREYIVPIQYFEHPKDMLKGTCFQVDWEKRPLWILEINMNDPDYLYSKKILYVKKSKTNTTCFGSEIYDQKGNFYRSQGVTVPYRDKKTFAEQFWFGVQISDHLTGHMTIQDMNPKYFDTDVTSKSFTFKDLLKFAR
jgi:hypothetical protein